MKVSFLGTKDGSIFHGLYMKFSLDWEYPFDFIIIMIEDRHSFSCEGAVWNIYTSVINWYN